MWREAVEKNGFGVLAGVFSVAEMTSLVEELARARLRPSRAGIRHALSDAAVAALGRDPRLLEIACEILRGEAFPFRATLFDKSPDANWLVPWHQDTALPLRSRQEVPGWGPWSVKDGVVYAHAPASALCRVVALRVHLDDSTAQNGPLRILSGTHTLGVLSDEEIHQLAATIASADCTVERGGVLAMRPLLVHASSKSRVPMSRRVLHIEYAISAHFGEGLELAIA